MRRIFPWYFFVGVFGLPTFFGLMITGIKPFSTYGYPFVWWSYILLVDGIVYWKKGSSLFTRLRVKFLFLIFFSFLFWVFFEILNLRIGNWNYYPHPLFIFPHPILIVIFGIFSFGTVLPAILETLEILEVTGPWKNLKFPRWRGRPKDLWILSGILMLVSALIWPQYFFWLIWIGPALILDPLIEENNGKSLSSQLREGNGQIFCLLLLVGFICGFLWEFWNYWAGLKWQYTVPFVGGWKIFEMPILGYFGFPPFAIECWLFYQWLKSKKIIKEVEIEDRC